MPTDFAKTTCQHCSGHIEFDASDFAEGETRSVECPHCHMDTLLYVRPPDPPIEKPKARLWLRDWISWMRAVPKPKWVAFISTTRFERMVFGIIRTFALFWAALMVLALVSVTFNYLRGFPAAESSADSIAARFVESKAWQNFAVYTVAVSFLLFMLTTISIVLLLLAIERNTRKDKHDVV